MTTVDDNAQQPGAAREGLLARHPLLFFFIIAYASTWCMWLPYALSEDGAGLLPISIPISFFVVNFIAVFGPTLAAFIMTGITEGRAGTRRLLGRYVLWRVGLRWYLFVLLGIPAIEVLGAVVLPGALASFQFQALAPQLALYPIGVVFTFFIGGPLGEEPGWRGFALPRLQRLQGPLVGSLSLGIFWGFWHLPLFLVTGWIPPTILNIVLFVTNAIAVTIIFTWVFNNTKGSLLIAILMHASFNTFLNGVLIQTFPAPIVTDYSILPVLVGFGAAALVVVALTRGRLGYEHYQREEPDSAIAPI
jgi:membrane protease YdiL (CAAX protease family)